MDSMLLRCYPTSESGASIWINNLLFCTNPWIHSQNERSHPMNEQLNDCNQSYQTEMIELCLGDSLIILLSLPFIHFLSSVSSSTLRVTVSVIR